MMTALDSHSSRSKRLRFMLGFEEQHLIGASRLAVSR